ncbi:MAG: hypothetical protein VYE68_10100 [Acidobacteriota bacterium]|nr:hypothetical protein [Acidobacteriota bacterium]
MSLYQPTARNLLEQSENRIHHNDVARQLGFAGGLVAGVTVFGHMTHPLVRALGADWLAGFTASLRLKKPAYDGDVLSIEHTETNREHLVRCTGRGGTLLAELRSRQGIAPLGELSTRPGGASVAERPLVEWDRIHEDEAFPSWSWTPTEEENATSVSEIDDSLELYRTGVVHPHLILSQANSAFSNRFVLPAWIHVGSEVAFRERVMVGDEVEVRTVPVQKWRKKGHEFVELHVAYVVGETVKTEIAHTAIFKVG